ncbi:glycosyltransferase family 2 protein [Enterococcus faecium]|uniref:glycosyltransferase family 2 protein n=1 Tax=Enterococcus faecium TaxID=1352 RepID=UPI000A355DB3|nr:glycosyltransferase family 2 protein [Enterococcus faecium]OTO50609.1 hypothetical protein A5814_002777 [Enterococcus faecium]
MYVLPEPVFFILSWLCKILVVLVFSNLIFYTVLSIFGLKVPKRNYQLIPDKRSFLFIIPANNEETVIGETLQGVLDLNYDRNLYDIVCIADNCRDKTSEIARKYDINVFENTSKPGAPRGKPHAIAAYLNARPLEWHRYDYIAFLDADNYLHKNYLQEVNSQLEAYPNLTVVQGYLGTKNVFSSFVSTGYAAVYYITNRAVQFAKAELGWNASIGGTGFVLDTNYVKEHGWNPRSYTEDFELQVELSIQGKESRWNHWAKTYDEKPNHIIVSHRQRKRWAQGHWLVGITQTPKQIKSIFQSKNSRSVLNKIETLFYSYSMIRPVAFFIIGILGLVDFRLLRYFPGLFSLLPFWLALEVFNFLVIPFIFCFQEGKHDFKEQKGIVKKMIFMCRLIVSFIWNTLTYSVIQVIGFWTWWKPQNNWVKTVHMMTTDAHISTKSKLEDMED